MDGSSESFFLIFLGLAAAFAIIMKSVFSRLKLSPVPAYIVFGILTRMLVEKWGFFSDSYYYIVQLFGDIGLILILFQVGVDSNLYALLRQIKNALVISISEVSISGLMVFSALYYILGHSLFLSIFVAVAFVATSIAVSVGAWKEAGQLEKKSGQLLLDLSAMDDIAGITLMVVAFSFVRSFSDGAEGFLDPGLYLSIFLTGMKMLLLIVLCYLFSVFIEPRFSKIVKKYEILPDPVVTIICLALIVSGLAGYLGLTIALGAFLIGLSFSRDPSLVRMLDSYQSLESFFIPFFFFSVGFSVTGIGDVSFETLGILLAAAVLGKCIGVGLPSYCLKLPLRESLLLGLSMVPRAEVTLVVIKYVETATGLPFEIYSECVLAVVITCFFPLFLKPLMSSK